MTLLLAVLLGNVCAWCVHIAAWWLRRSAITFMSWLGLVSALFMFAGSWTMANVTLYRMQHPVLTQQMRTNSSLWVVLLPVLFPWAILIAVGLWHVRLLKKDSYEGGPLAFFSVFAEFFFAFLLFLTVALRPLVNPNLERIQAQSYWLATYWVSLILLAIFRPLVVRYSSRFRDLTRAKSVEQTHRVLDKR